MSTGISLQWFTTAGILLSAGDTTLAFDPFLGRLGADGACADAYRSADFCFVTHGHFDHILDIPALYGGKNVPVYATETPRRTLRKSGMDETQLRPIAGGTVVSAGAFSVQAFSSRHCRFDAGIIRQTVFRKETFLQFRELLRLSMLRAKYPENGETLFYEISCGETHVQLLGSMNLDESTVYPTGADALIFPLQGRSDQDTYALQFIERLAPKRVLLDHYDNSFPPISSEIDVSGFVRNVTEQFRIPCEPLRRGATISL